MAVPKATLIKNVTMLRNKARMNRIFPPFVGRTYIEGLYLDRSYETKLGRAKIRPGNRCVRFYRLTCSSPLLDSGIERSSGIFAIITRKISRRVGLLSC